MLAQLRAERTGKTVGVPGGFIFPGHGIFIIRHFLSFCCGYRQVRKSDACEDDDSYGE